jgi:CBS-domain-containing membrane protein
MRLTDIMSTGVLTCTPETPAEQAWNTMRVNSVHHLVVVDDRRRVVGIASAGDLGGRRRLGAMASSVVADFMSAPVVCADEDTTVRSAANLLRGHAIGCLPVLREGTLVGIVTLSDMLELLGRGAEKPTARAERYTLKHRGNRPAGPQRP